jgi:hypothetical protein
VPNCGSRREPPETPLRVCGIRWRPVSRGLTALKRPVACILDTHHSRSGHEIENLRGGQSVRTPLSAQLRATRLDMKDENLHRPPRCSEDRQACTDCLTTSSARLTICLRDSLVTTLYVLILRGAFSFHMAHDGARAIWIRN